MYQPPPGKRRGRGKGEGGWGGWGGGGAGGWDGVESDCTAAMQRRVRKGRIGFEVRM